MKRLSPIILILLVLLVFTSIACICSIFNQRDPLVFSPEELPDATLDILYEVTITTSQNDTPVGSISLSEGTLPPGLELVYTKPNPTAKISGIPTHSGTYTFTIQVWCYGTNTSGQTAEKQYTIVVTDLAQSRELVFSPDLLPDAQVGLSYVATITISQNRTPAGGYSLVEGMLPPGLELEYVQKDYSARIIGTPTQAGTFAFTINVWCFGTQESGQTGEMKYIIEVGP
jgi:hypothetical protein